MVALRNDQAGLEGMGALLREVARLHLRAQREQVACCGTTVAECHVLTELGRSGPVPMKDLGKRLGLHKGWVSRAVAGLVADGLLLRSAVTSDGRVVVIQLSAQGRRKLGALNRTLDRQAARVLGHVPRAERARVSRALAQVRSALRRELGLSQAGVETGQVR